MKTARSHCVLCLCDYLKEGWRRRQYPDFDSLSGWRSPLYGSKCGCWAWREVYLCTVFLKSPLGMYTSSREDVWQLEGMREFRRKPSTNWSRRSTWLHLLRYCCWKSLPFLFVFWPTAVIQPEVSSGHPVRWCVGKYLRSKATQRQ